MSFDFDHRSVDSIDAAAVDDYGWPSSGRRNCRRVCCAIASRSLDLIFFFLYIMQTKSARPPIPLDNFHCTHFDFDVDRRPKIWLIVQTAECDVIQCDL